MKRWFYTGRTWPKKLWLVLVASAMFYFCFLNYTEPTQVGIARNWFTGKMWLQEGGGWHLSLPWTWIARVDTRPIRVSVPSSGHGYSAKLVQFEPKAWEDFIYVEGWRYYWWSNRFSFNFGYEEEHRGMKDILRGHAYGTKKYSFITILSEYDKY